MAARQTQTQVRARHLQTDVSHTKYLLDIFMGKFLQNSRLREISIWGIKIRIRSSFINDWEDVDDTQRLAYYNAFIILDPGLFTLNWLKHF